MTVRNETRRRITDAALKLSLTDDRCIFCNEKRLSVRWMGPRCYRVSCGHPRCRASGPMRESPKGAVDAWLKGTS